MKIYTLLYENKPCDDMPEANVVKVSKSKEELQEEAMKSLNKKLAELGVTDEEINDMDVFVYKSEMDFSINHYGSALLWTIQEFEV